MSVSGKTNFKSNIKGLEAKSEIDYDASTQNLQIAF
jgi:hypothetical protein